MSESPEFLSDVEELITKLRKVKGEVFADTQGKTTNYYATAPDPTPITAAMFKELMRRQVIYAEKGVPKRPGQLMRQKYFLHEVKS